MQGEPIYFATAMPFLDDAAGLLVKSHMGHPVKVEGNPKHPASLGATGVHAQASLMDLYDPDRSAARDLQRAGERLGLVLGALEAMLADQMADRGARLRILTGTVISPTSRRPVPGAAGAIPGRPLAPVGAGRAR